MKKLLRNLLILTVILVNYLAFASIQEEPKKEIWQFDGVFGRFDKRAIQRGYQVYKEICVACHALSQISYRNLEEIGFSKDEVVNIAAQYQVNDGLNDKGEMLQRPGKPYDKFVLPYPNEAASRAANNGAYPPDLSLIIKARGDGANYVHALLNGYGHGIPKGMKINNGMYYNPYFPNMQIAMPPPLSDGMVTYQDGTVATVEQMSSDLVNFLQWTAEPEMEKRKAMGGKVIVFLFILITVFYMAKTRIWANVEKKNR